MELIEKQVYRSIDGADIRLLRVDHNAGEFWVIDLAQGMPYQVNREFFSPSKMEGMIEDPYETDIEDHQLSKSALRIRKSRLDVISKLVHDPRSVIDPQWRYQKIKDIVDAGKAKKTSCYHWIRLYWVKGCTNNALLPDFDKCGGLDKEKVYKDNIIRRKTIVPTKINVLTREVKTLIAKGYLEYYGRNPKINCKQARINFMAEKKLPQDLFSYKRWTYWGAKLNDPLVIMKLRQGEDNFNRNTRTNRGTARDGVFGPFSEVMIDSTRDNMRIVRIDGHNKYIGRLTLYLAVDVFSAAIVGFYISPEHASYVVGCLCLVNMAEDKVELSKRYGYPTSKGDWGPNYLGGRLLADRAEFISNMSSAITNNLGIDISNSPTARPDLKSYAETQIHICQSKIKGALQKAGLIDKTDEPRVTRDSRKDACIDLNRAIGLIIPEIVYHNNNHWMKEHPLMNELTTEGVDLYPLEVLRWGLRKGLGNPIKKSKLTVWRNALPRADVPVTENQIVFKKRSFKPVDPSLSTLVDRIRFGDGQCQVAYNPINFDQTYLVDGKNLHPLLLTSGAKYQNYFEFDFLAQDTKERQKLHSVKAEAAEIKKASFQLKSINEAVKSRAKNVDFKNTRENLSQEIQSHQDQVMSNLDPESYNAMSIKSLKTSPDEAAATNSHLESKLSKIRNSIKRL